MAEEKVLSFEHLRDQVISHGALMLPREGHGTFAILSRSHGGMDSGQSHDQCV
jgi:hypothetical protein